MKETAQVLALMFVLVGCSNSDSSTTQEETSIEKSGKVADGYLSNAKVCFDLNNNLLCDSNESSVQTNSSGGYQLTYKEKLPEHVAMLAYGGTNSATNLAYQGFLTAPIEYDNITPVTTLVEYQKRASSSLEKAEEIVAKLFNLDIEDLPKDHIAQSKIDKKLFKASMRIEKLLNVVASLDGSNKRDLKKINRILRKVAKIATKAQNFIDALAQSASEEYDVDQTVLNNNLSVLSNVIDKESEENNSSDEAEQAIELATSKTKEYTQANRTIEEGTLEAIVSNCSDNYLSCLDTTTATPPPAPTDTTPPTITLKGDNPQIIELGESYQELGEEVSDNVDTNPILEIDSSKIDVSKLGEYQVIYRAKDSAGNESSSTRVVKVIKRIVKTIEPLEKVYDFGKGNYTLENAPLGMRILNNGLLTWTPSPSQVGDINVSILKDGEKVASLIAQVEDSGKAIDGYFVDMTFPAYSRDEDGSEEHPYGDIERACGHSKPGDIFYARGGVYTTPEYMENNNSNRGFKVVGCKGTADNPVIFKPWGNESVKIVSDATTGIAIFNSEHVIVDGFEVEGVSQKISFEEAVGQWWNDLKYYNGSGISMNQNTHDIVVQNCVVHDVPASGIKSHGATHITIKDNIVYNTNWWTTLGTTGVGIVSAPPLEGEDNSTHYNKILGNLLFGSEQRLYSRVWFKSGSEFVIDEGEAVLVQEVMRTKTDENNNTYRTDYEGRYLVQDNLLAYNGAGIVINISNKSDVINNTLYMSGTTTLNPYTNLSYSCITANSSYDVKMIKNIVKAKENGIVIWYNKEVKDLYKEENHVSGHVLRYDFMNQDGLVIYDKNATLLKSDFSPIDELEGLGANSSAIMAKAKKLGIEVKPTNYVIDYPKLTQAIFDAMPDDVKVLRIDDTSSSRSTSIFVKLPNKDEEYYLRVPNRYLEGVKLPEVSQ